MKTQGSWLFEAPLAHEMGKYGNSYSSQEYYYNPEFELARALQHELEANYHDGGEISIKRTPVMSFAKPLEEVKGEKGVYIKNRQRRPTYVGSSSKGQIYVPPYVTQPLTPAERKGLKEHLKQRKPLTDEMIIRIRSDARWLWQERTKGKGRQPKKGGWEVHHLIPLEFAHLFPEKDPNDPSNLVLMPTKLHNDLHTKLNEAFRGKKVDRKMIDTIVKVTRENWGYYPLK